MNRAIPSAGRCPIPAALCLCLAWNATAQVPVDIDALTNEFPAQVAVTNRFEAPTPSPLPSGPTTPGAGQPGAASMGTSSLAGSSASVPSSQVSGHPMAYWGPFSVYPHLLYRFAYGNGVGAAVPGVNDRTAIQTLAPGVLLGLGTHWTLDYTPTLRFYSSSLYRDTLDQSVLLHGTAARGDWSFGLAQSYALSTQPLVETGVQTDQEMYSTALTAASQLSDKLSLQLGLNQNFRFVQGFPALHEWSTSDWLNYQVEPPLSLALGPTVGYDQMSFGSDMPFEELMARISFKPGTKLQISVDGGASDRQFLHPSAAPLVTPVFDATVFYQLFQGTSLSIFGSRTVTPSLFGNEVNVITSVSANFRQRVVANLYFEAAAGYSSEPFTSIVPGPLPAFFLGTPPRTTLQEVRHDTTEYAKASLTATFRQRVTGSVFYYASQNSSSQADFSYKSTQIGLELSYRY